MNKILIANDSLFFDTKALLKFFFNRGELLFVDNYEDLLYKLHFDHFGADILFLNLEGLLIDSSCFSFFENDLRLAIYEILNSNLDDKMKLCKICQLLVNTQYNKQLNIIVFVDNKESLEYASQNGIFAISLLSMDVSEDLSHILDTIKLKRKL